MIVIFGASSDIGRRAAKRLLDTSHDVRLIARAPVGLDERAERIVGTMADAQSLTADADTVVSCAHARFAHELLRSAARNVRQFVLVGSAWRYSQVPNPRADEVRSAEAEFVRSQRNGVLLHPTMIYGGVQEQNLQRLIAVIRRWPVVPLPGGGHHLVQPIHVDDVAACIVAAVETCWTGPHVMPLAGPVPMPWRDMVLSCIRELRIRRLLLPLPIAPIIAVLSLAERLGIKGPLDPNVLHRFREDVSVSIGAMQSELAVTPRPFEVGLREALSEWTGSPYKAEPAI